MRTGPLKQAAHPQLRQMQKSKYFNKECSPGFHVYPENTQLGGICLCGHRVLESLERGYIKRRVIL